jgi:hypothetical protein
MNGFVALGHRGNPRKFLSLYTHTHTHTHTHLLPLAHEVLGLLGGKPTAGQGVRHAAPLLHHLLHLAAGRALLAEEIRWSVRSCGGR